MPLTSQMKELGDALVTWWSAQVSGMSLVSFDWAPQMRAQPSYPCSPKTQCPRVQLRMFQFSDTFAGQLGCEASAFGYQISLWLQLCQTPGQAHQELLVDALDDLKTPLLQADFDLTTALSSVSGLRFLRLEPNQFANTVVYDELDHPLGDPALRVSTGELNLTMLGEFRV